MSEKFTVPPDIIANEDWKHFTKRELVAARLLERMVASVPSPSQADEASMPDRAARMADNLFVSLYPQTNAK